MKKQELRKLYKQKRNILTEEDILDYSQKIANQLLKMDIWQKELYHIFFSIEEKKEVNTEFLLNLLFGKDKTIAVSKTNFENHTLSHFILTENTQLKVNRWGIPEPEKGIQISENQIDVVFVPLLCFDVLGNRIGYGKGVYDNFLSQCRSDVIKIGLSFFEAENPFKEVFSTDIKLDFCVTPTNIYQF